MKLSAESITFFDYRDCYVYCFTETRLTPDYPDSALQLPGFTVHSHDRNSDITEKSRGGGVCLLINENWCTDVCIISQVSTSNLESITIKLRRFYLSRDFSSATSTAVYIHPRADTNAVVKDLYNKNFMCENDDPNTLSIVAGDLSKQT